MGIIQQSEVNINWIVVCLLALLLGPIGTFISAKLMMNMEKAWLGYLLWSFIPILNLINWLDLTLLAKKLVDEGAVNEFYHPIAFMAELPLNHE